MKPVYGCRNIQKNNDLKFIHYILLHILHLTKWKLFQMGNIEHLVIETLLVFMGCHIPMPPILSEIFTIKLINTNSKLWFVALTIVKKTVLKDWKSENT